MYRVVESGHRKFYFRVIDGSQYWCTDGALHLDAGSGAAPVVCRQDIPWTQPRPVPIPSR